MTEKAELQTQLQGSQEDLQTIQHNYVALSGKVMGLEKQVKAVKDKLYKTTECKAASRETAMLEAKQQAIEQFKQSEEYQSSQDYDARYDKGVEEIFYNIQRKHGEVNYKFLGKEYQQLTTNWEEQEKNEELDSKPPPSSMYSDEDCEIIKEKETVEDANNPTANA